MAKTPAINHGSMFNGDVHFTILNEGKRLKSGKLSEKNFETKLYIYYKDLESMPTRIEDEGQIFDKEWLHWKAKAFVKSVKESILDGHG
jgi:hypothetical protein